MPQFPPTPVLFVHHRSELGGAPESLSYLIRELDRERFEPHVYCPPGPAAELFREAGANVHTGAVAGFTHIWASTYRGRRWLLFLRELGLLPHHVMRFRRTLRRHRFELVHFNDSPLIPAAWLARRESLPVVWHLRSALRDAGLAASYLIVGGAVRGQEFFQTVVGRSLQLADLTRDYESEAKALVDELGMSEVVRFVPFTQDTHALYQASDVVVAPSQGPELGRPVIEAAASGVPVVASGSRTGGGVVVPGETGVLVEDYGAETLADAVEELLRDEERRRALGRKAREHAERNFDPARNARRIESIYRRIAPQRERIPILYVHHRPQLGGAPSSLAQLIANLDERFEPHVFCPEGPAAELFAAAGATVHTGDVSIFAHAWDSPYEGLRWLVLRREVAALPPHLRQLERLMRGHRLPLVHLNGPPLLPAAWGAHRPRRRTAPTERGRSACRRTGSRSASPASSAGRRGGRNWSPRRSSSSSRA